MNSGMMLYTPQQQMGCEGYRLPCRTGNWAEDEILQQAQTEEFLLKSATGSLSVSKLGNTIGVATAPAALPLAHPDGQVRFGDVIMLSSALGGAVCANASERVDLSFDAFQVTRAVVDEPQRRACWTVSPVGDAPPADGLLRFGMPFELTAAAVDDDELLYLHGERYTLTNAAYSNSMRSAERKHCVCLSKTKSYLTTQWAVVPLSSDPVERLELANQPVPANTFIALEHLGTKLNLCSDEHKERNRLGKEFSVSLFKDAHIAKHGWGSRERMPVGPGNHFAFTTGV